MAREKVQATERTSGEERARRRRPQVENAIRWDEARQAKVTGAHARAVAENRAGHGPGPGQKEKTDSDVKTGRQVPASVRERFVQVGDKFHFPDGARAFTDNGVKLTTPSESTQLIRDLVAIAQERGWQRIAVSGTQRFRKEAWTIAREAGLEVKGYRASELDEARLARRVGRGSSETAETQPYGTGAASSIGVREGKAAAAPRQHMGRLIDHGLAPYKHDPHEATSYFVKLETQRGEREVWGVDLERAFRESLSRPQVGDDVVVRAVSRDPVTVKRSRGEPGELDELQEVATHRNRWIVEKQEFLERREKAAEVLRDPTIAAAKGSRAHPELLGAYLQVNAAELASKHFRDTQDRERFVSMVRSALADSVARGEPLPAVRLRQNERTSRIGMVNEGGSRLTNQIGKPHR